MLDDMTLIESKTGYTPGDLYVVRGKDNKKQVKKCDENIYDEKTGNFHIVPADYDKWLKEVSKARKLILDYFKRQNWKDDISFACHYEGKRNPGRGGKNALSIEKYIIASRGCYDYLLCFETLYCDGNKVSCDLGAIQFYRCKQCSDGVNKSWEFREALPEGFSKDPLFKMCYPLQGDSFHENSNGNMVYSPNQLKTIFELIDISEDEQEEELKNIFDAFVKFILQDVEGK